MRLGVFVSVATNLGWFAAIERAENAYSFVLDSLTRGNLDNDLLLG